MSKKSVVTEAQEIQLAIELINLGARLQLLETEVSLSRERLLKLYKELKGVSPPKGMLPFSTDWFLTWQPNIHSSLFLNIHNFLVEHAGASGIHAVMKAYQLYGANAAGRRRRAAALADPRLDLDQILRQRQANAEIESLHLLQGQVRGRRHGPEPRLQVRPVPYAFARRQDPQGQGCR